MRKTRTQNGASALVLLALAPAWRQTRSRSTPTMRRIPASRRQLLELRLRMSPKKTMLIFLLAVLLASLPIKSTVVRTLDVASLTSQPHIIVIGQVISATDRGPSTLDLGGGLSPATTPLASLQAAHRS